MHFLQSLFHKASGKPDAISLQYQQVKARNEAAYNRLIATIEETLDEGQRLSLTIPRKTQ